MVFFFNDTATTEIYTLSLHDALPIWLKPDPDFWFRTFAPADLEDAATNIGLGTCVAIEAGRTTRENHALGQWANNFSLIGAFIPYIDLESHDLGQQLDAWQEHAKFRGVRMGFEGHADPGILQKASILEGLREIARRELIFEFLVLPTHLQIGRASGRERV